MRKWIPPDDVQGYALLSTLLFSLTTIARSWRVLSGSDPLGRSLSLGFYFVHSRHEQDFCESEAINRVLRDLEHTRLHSDAQDIAGYVPVRVTRKCPTQ